MIFKVKKLHPDAILPTQAHDFDLGMDLYAVEDVTLINGHVTKIKTGIAMEFPHDTGALIRDRSSVATKDKIFVVAGVIDPSYRGEIIVAMYMPYMSGNMGILKIEKGKKIAQLIPIKSEYHHIIEVDELNDTSRGTGGFGSTGN